MYVCSPLVSAVLYGDDTINVNGARSLKLQDKNNPNNVYVFVFSNKIGFVGEIDDRFLFQVKEDFRKYRQIGGSMRLQWAGQEILKNGTFNVARITDKEGLSTFNPNNKADSTVANGSDVIICTPQHNAPIFEFTDTDANDESGSGNKPTPGNGDDGKYEYGSAVTPLPQTPFEVDILSLSTITSPTTLLAAAVINSHMRGQFNTPAAQQMSSDIVAGIRAKYPKFANQQDTTTIYNCEIQLDVEYNLTAPGNLRDSFVVTLKTSNIQSTDATFFRDIIAATQPSIPSTPLPFQNANTQAVAYYRFRISIPIDGNIRQNVQVFDQILPQLRDNSINNTPFYDANYLQPVVQYNGLQPIYQVLTKHDFEFILSDDTVLGAAAVAQTPKNPEEVVSKTDFTKFQAIMKGMPPAIIMGDTGMSRTSMSQLASRGIIKDIFNLAAPIAGAIFPGIRPFTNAAKPLVDVIDNAF